MTRMTSITRMTVWTLAALTAVATITVNPPHASVPADSAFDIDTSWHRLEVPSLEYSMRGRVTNEPLAYLLETRGYDRGYDHGGVVSTKVSLPNEIAGEPGAVKLSWFLDWQEWDPFNVTLVLHEAPVISPDGERFLHYTLELDSGSGVFTLDSSTREVTGWVDPLITQHPLFIELEEFTHSLVRALEKGGIGERIEPAIARGGRLGFSSRDAVGEIGFFWAITSDSIRQALANMPHPNEVCSQAAHLKDCERCCSDNSYWGTVLCGSGASISGFLAGAAVAATGVASPAAGYIGLKSGATVMLACAGIVRKAYDDCLRTCDEKFAPKADNTVTPVSIYGSW